MSANSRPLVATIYNPHNQSKEALIAGFTARKAKFDRLFRDIREAPMTKPEQHYLVQGVRGMGKTTFLLRLAYEVQNTPELAERLIPIVFNEEEYGISSLADFWERTARYLEEADPTFAGLEDQITAQYGGDDYERAALGTLLSTLRQHDKKLLLFIDNIGDLFRKFDGLENKRLREVLLTAPELRLIGATPTLIEQTHDYSKPYFDFFKVIQLGGLNQEETNELFLKLGEAYGTNAARELSEKRPGRIEALRRLTGGVIRTMVLLFEIIVEDNTGSVFRDLNALIDRVTPLYKHRIDDLPTQQQKIVAALANAWDAASAKELAQTVRLESKVVSAQIKQLINNGLVEKVETNTKNNLYRLEDRFFNIWYLMRFGRKTDERALWLIRFFEEMFDGDEEWLEDRIVLYIKELRTGLIDPQAALYITTAYSKITQNEVIENLLKMRTRLFLSDCNFVSEEILEPSKMEIVNRMIQEKNFEYALLELKKFKKLTTLTILDYSACQLLCGQTLTSPQILIAFAKLPDDELKNMSPYEALSHLSLISYLDRISRNDNGSEIDISKISDNDTAVELVSQYFLRGIRGRKNVCYDLIKFFKKSNTFVREHLLEQLIKLWNDNFEIITDLGALIPIQSSNTASKYYEIPQLKNSVVDAQSKDRVEDIQIFIAFRLLRILIRLLLAKKQYHTAYNYFQQEEWQLKGRFKPLYYATMYFLQDEYPTEYLRMGPELAETVQDILKEVDQMAIDYA